MLARTDTGQGREELYAAQLPQVLKGLSENARIASITASNAIERRRRRGEITKVHLYEDPAAVGDAFFG